MRSLLPLGPALFAALTLSTLAPSARADIAPPPGFVESCTLARHKSPARECLGCSAYHGNSNHCSESLASYGFTHSCSTRGASVWAEVWCRPASAQAKSVPQEVLLQLDNAIAHPPAPTAPPPVAPPPGPSSLLDPPPPPAPTPPPEPPAPPIADAPVAPPPMPPTGGCGGCATLGPETAVWAPLLALGALAIGWSRRRNRR